MWEEGGKRRNGSAKELYKEHTEYFKDIERTIENEIRQQALTM